MAINSSNCYYKCLLNTTMWHKTFNIRYTMTQQSECHIVTFQLHIWESMSHCNVINDIIQAICMSGIVIQDWLQRTSKYHGKNLLNTQMWCLLVKHLWHSYVTYVKQYVWLTLCSDLTLKCDINFINIKDTIIPQNSRKMYEYHSNLA